MCAFCVWLLVVDLHPEERGGSVLAELGFGDGVAGVWLALLRLAVRFDSLVAVSAGRVPRAVLALEGLVGDTAAPLLDAVVAVRFEAVHGLWSC